MTEETRLSAARIAIVKAIDEQWDKHAQPITVHVPGGAGTQRQVDGGMVVGRLGFNLAIMAIMDQLVGEP